MSKIHRNSVRRIDPQSPLKKGSLPPISPQSRNSVDHKFYSTLSPSRFPRPTKSMATTQSSYVPNKRLYSESKNKMTLDNVNEDKTGIVTILKETKNEIVEQINELYNEEDPELFLQYAKTVSK